MEYFIGAVWSVLELICFSIFCSSFLSKNSNHKKCVFFYSIAFCFMYVFTNVLPIANIQPLVNIAAYVCLSFCLYRGHWIKHLLSVILLFVFATAIDSLMLYGASYILGIGYSDLIWRKFTYITVVTIGKLIEILIAYIVFNLRPISSNQRIQGKWLLLLLLFPTASFFVIITTFSLFALQNDLPAGAFIMCTILGLTNIANIYLVRAMEKSSLKDQEILLVNQQMELQTQSILDLEKQYTAQRQAAHEHQRQLQTIHDLLTTDNVNAAQSYIEELRGKQATLLCRINCHHPIIDAILNQKYQIATEHSIDMQIQVNNLAAVKLSANELVVLLSNLLDNAIEACERINHNRIIDCRIILGDCLYISIRNTSLPVVITDGIILTSKPTPNEHGFGLIGIRHVLDHCKAEYTYHYDNGWFQFVAEIPNVI